MRPIDSSICEDDEENDLTPRSKEEENPQIPKLGATLPTRVLQNVQQKHS